MGTIPAIFVSHGMPAIVLASHEPTHQFLRTLGASFEHPAAILCVSAHWETVRPMVTGSARPETIHDFGGPPSLFEKHYPVNGAPEMAEEVIRLLKQAGFDPDTDPTRGLDHGAWVPLLLMYPDAHILVVQLSIQTELDPNHHLALGRALAPLRERGVLIMRSGGATHNLPEIDRYRIHSEPPDYALAFDRWLEESITNGREDLLVAYQEEGPFASRNHPFPAEHFLPIFVPLGSATVGTRGRIL